jgi:hypothetical protein
MQRVGIVQNAEPKASKSFRACDAFGARFGVLGGLMVELQRGTLTPS